MCRDKNHGGRRCQENLTKKQIRNLKRSTHNTASVAKLERLQEAQTEYGDIVQLPPFSLDLPPKTMKVINHIADAGGKPLVVGGSVRDGYYDSIPKDFDIEVHNMDIEAIISLLRRRGYNVDEVGKQFGVLKVRAGEDELDISVPREDSLTGAGHRDFDVTVDENMGVYKAAQRRDFTLNALMYDPHRNVVIDPTGGVQDLKNNTLRHVSDAFSEDPLRPLRAFQFVGRFGLELAPETAQISKDIVDKYDELPVERVQGEWEKFYLKAKHPELALQALKDMGWDQKTPSAHKIVSSEVGRVYGLTAELPSEDKVAVRSAVLTSHMSPGEAHEFRRHTIIGDNIARKARVLNEIDLEEDAGHYDIRTEARGLGKKGLTIRHWHLLQQSMEAPHPRTAEIVALAKEDEIYESAPPTFVMGRDLLALYPNRQPGPWVGAAVSRATRAQDEGVFRTKEDALAWASKEENLH